jgi:hypothetical protein
MRSAEERVPLYAVRRGLARPRFLVTAQKEWCRHCEKPTRVVSVWSTSRGVMERITWCRYCFDAECSFVSPTAKEQEAFAEICQAVERHAPVVWFDCARLATDELERQGTL